MSNFIINKKQLLINADSNDVLDEMIKEGNKVDVIISDLPYGVTNAKHDVKINLNDFWKKIESITDVFITTAQGQFMIDLVNSRPSKKWRWYDLVWDKKLTSGFLNAKRQPLRRHEQVLVFYKKQAIYNPQYTQGKPLHSKGNNPKINTNRNYGNFKVVDDKRKGSTEKYPVSIIEFQKPHPSIAVHATQKPVSLYEWIIKTYTNECDAIMDPFMGSGTTGVAAMNLNRRFIGVEINDEYFKIAKERIEGPK